MFLSAAMYRSFVLIVLLVVYLHQPVDRMIAGRCGDCGGRFEGLLDLFFDFLDGESGQVAAPTLGHHDRSTVGCDEFRPYDGNQSGRVFVVFGVDAENFDVVHCGLTCLSFWNWIVHFP